jgi:adenylate cyclase
LALPSPDADAAERQLRTAIQVAETQHARSLALRAATSLNSLLRTTGRIQEAVEIIGPIFRSIQEGLDTKDLLEARQVFTSKEASA